MILPNSFHFQKILLMETNDKVRNQKIEGQRKLKVEQYERRLCSCIFEVFAI